MRPGTTRWLDNRFGNWAGVLAAYSLPVLALTVLNAGCTHLSTNPDEDALESLPPEIVSEFAYPAAPIENTTAVLSTAEDFVVNRIELHDVSDVFDSHTIMIDHYVVDAPRPTPAVLVLPILNGNNMFAKRFAKYFAKHGFSALIVHRQEQYLNPENLGDRLNDVFKQIVLDHKRALDWAVTVDSIDPERIGIFGISAGAIKGAMVSALDARISASVLVMGGGDVPYVLAYSNERRIAAGRKAYLAERGLTPDQWYERLHADFSNDPLDYARYIDPRDTLMILARFDKIVHYQNGIRLREEIGNPETVVLPTGHYSAILFIQYIKKISLRFFQERFDRAGVERRESE